MRISSRAGYQSQDSQDAWLDNAAEPSCDLRLPSHWVSRRACRAEGEMSQAIRSRPDLNMMQSDGSCSKKLYQIYSELHFLGRRASERPQGGMLFAPPRRHWV